MGASMSTLGGWTLVLCIAGYYAFRYMDQGRQREAARAASQRQRLEDRHSTQNRKEVKDKAKRQRGDAFNKDPDGTDKAAKPKPRAAKSSDPTSAPSQLAVNDDSDDGEDNREFARQLATVKQGTSFLGSGNKDEKRQKSVKQSRAQERDNKLSPPSSTAGADADDDRSSITSPETRASDAGGVSDMLEPTASGPSVLRLTDTDNKKKKKEVKTKAPEKVETKKQRQNRLKAEAAKLAREEADKERKVKMEAQRRLARISEGRPANDGSSFTAAQSTPSVWTSKPTNGASNGNTDGSYLPVQPLDTFSPAQPTDAPKDPAPAVDKADSWISSLPSEEEQLEMLRDEEDSWNTVKAKKSSKTRPKKQETAAEEGAVQDAQGKPEPIVRDTSSPAVIETQAAAVNGKRPKAFNQQSSFAALSSNDEPEVEEEWDV